MAGTAGTTDADRAVRLPRATAVKNKQAAPTQITAEQILRESKALQADEFRPPSVKITDPEELAGAPPRRRRRLRGAEYRLGKRKQFEDHVRRVGRWNASSWIKYALWEEAQKDFRRARSVWERALDVDHRNVSVWLKYVEMEMRHRFVNHARNVWDRAVTLLPRVDQLWYKYVHMEEMLGNVAGARQVLERWMAWEPDHHGWAAYVKLELRYGEADRAAAVYERYVRCLPSVKAWVRYARFEMQRGDAAAARRCYERAVEELGEDAQDETLYIRFAEFEEMVKEPARARAIYRYALDHLPRAAAAELYRRYAAFEKQRGDRDGVEEVIASERRLHYEAAVAANPLDYDAWFDYARLEEGAGDAARCREVYERAVACVPPAPEKRYWQRYVYLWIKYALFEELDAGDAARCREVYRAALKLVPHRAFTFAKLWVMAAQFEVRARRLDAARRILGTALGLCPKPKLFRCYIEMELALGCVDRCRTLYQKYLEWAPANAAAWGRFAELEASLGEADRARALYELAIAQPALDMPEALWKAYVDFEIGEGSREGARALYERLLQRTQHVKVWLSYAAFEAAPLALLAAPADDEEGGGGGGGEAARRAEAEAAEGGAAGAAAREARARAVYERAFRALRESQPDAKEEAVAALEAWRAFEAGAGRAEAEAEAERRRAVEAVEAKLPRRVKRKRPIVLEDGSRPGGVEEYYDYIFPDQQAAAPNLKLLEAAHKWKKARLEAAAAGEGGAGS
jgi:crooked neck